MNKSAKEINEENARKALTWAAMLAGVIILMVMYIIGTAPIVYNYFVKWQ